MKTAVLISGRGSNLQALIGAGIDIVLVISNVPDARGLGRAKKAGIATAVIDHKDFDDRETFDQAMTKAIEDAGAELVCLAGFMRILSDDFIKHWWDRLINIHPSLLPDFKGLDVHQRVIDARANQSGCTVHFVRPEMDSGPIIMQATVPVMANDDAGALAARILVQEHIIYPKAVKLIAEGRVSVEDDKALIDGSPAV
ncbi:MAG: phosphoribosylglycinamide formyltransferase [Rhodospirillales bacterium]|nr:phosphoribosylglycinamide formyltransferase [Rhodospirillales bacterium]